MFRWVRVSVSTFIVLLIGHMSEAHAFPWDFVSRQWWVGSVEDFDIRHSFTYEQGADIGYWGYKDTIYRVLYESPDTAFLLLRSDDEDTVKYQTEFLCIRREAERNNITGLISARPHYWFSAYPAAPIHDNTEYFTLSNQEILDRILRNERLWIDYRHPVDCAAWIQGKWRGDEKLPYFKNYEPYYHGAVGDRTPFPRSGF